jgi:hypothetical protein
MSEQKIADTFSGKRKATFKIIDNKKELQEILAKEKVEDVNAFWRDNYTFRLELVRPWADAVQA